MKFDVIIYMILNREPSNIVNVRSENKIKRKRKLEGAVLIVTKSEDQKYIYHFSRDSTGMIIIRSRSVMSKNTARFVPSWGI